MHSSNLQATDQRGFTVVELMVSIVVLGILAVGVLGILTSYFAIMTRNSEHTLMTSSSQQYLRGVSEEIRYSAGVRNSNNISDSNAPAGGWDVSAGRGALIISTPAIDKNTNEFIIDTAGTGNPYLNEFIYYLDGDKLYKRTLANTSASNNKVETSCPPDPPTPGCRNDRLMLEYVNSINVVYFDEDNIITSSAIAARSVRVEIQMFKETFGQPLTFDTAIRSTLRNRL